MVRRLKVSRPLSGGPKRVPNPTQRRIAPSHCWGSTLRAGDHYSERLGAETTRSQEKESVFSSPPGSKAIFEMSAPIGTPRLLPPPSPAPPHLPPPLAEQQICKSSSEFHQDRSDV
ncbi:hypothetical protein CEXT_64601 [Caerostris extrusa]|uniref:Uncharacterized protein n=1 Tax=Caerostris extrusa TaxID=172846 RepID=A0AAV4R591_CAEEX|nr:hypothetical protein CEXT_64601 [Caerostris extrusa]